MAMSYIKRVKYSDTIYSTIFFNICGNSLHYRLLNGKVCMHIYEKLVFRIHKNYLGHSLSDIDFFTDHVTRKTCKDEVMYSHNRIIAAAESVTKDFRVVILLFKRPKQKI